MFITINDSVFKVKVCNSGKEKSEGMMGKKFTDFTGMLFLMGHDIHCFYMKNCIIPLDIIFIDEDLTISSISHNCLPCGNEDDCESYCGFGKYVLEIDGGYCKEKNISIGDYCTFTFDIFK